ncbi:aldo/keto reductase [Halorientalis regularis]|jgi:aryl-alcohol dehydrogenase-like predicted oxidoreductase|uniref:Predicted oxidoreductase n=1 Tax=Halorientalis regularis TaxID=660518 RepID=A0A1G7QNJ8_9EURY|nr:aldo/keto reductase [Halorientalis regularis]SDG00082.1 Predicted oxidoreductase [Halorientalis regularis]
MNQRELGNSGVEVSEVGFGAWVVGTDWWGDRSREQAVDMVQHALDRGINFFDTGDVYGHGDSEELVGEALSEHREEVTVSTKVGYDFYNNPQAGHGELPKRVDPEWIRTALDRSLDRLGMDYVDVLMLHNANVDEVTPDVLETLDELREEGKVEAIGWALGPSIGWLAEATEAVEQEFDALQLVFNVFEQTPGRHAIEEVRRLDADTAILPRVPHSSGLLNEQVTPDTELGEGDHRAHRPQEWYETGWEKVDALRFLERDGERTMGQAAIQWLLAFDEVASVTPTFRTADDIDEWAGAADTPALSEEEFQRVEDLAEDNFGIDRDDGMDALRSSVGGADLEDIDKQAAGD